MTSDTNFEAVKIDGEVFFKISNVDSMPPFFMSIVSDSNHWMFLSSNGGITAGRKDAEYALFPYYTDDKLTDSTEHTGSKTIIRIAKKEDIYLWEPFSVRTQALYNCSRNLYKNKYGNKIIFEEINHDLELSFSYEWNSSNLYGFVRKSKLHNLSPDVLNIELLDGLQNILPYGVGSELQTRTSNLANAYKRSELVPESGLGIYALSAIIVDKAEPSEALKANIAWSIGLSNPLQLLSSLQLQAFRTRQVLHEEDDIKGEKGAYFIASEFQLTPQQVKDWMIVMNVNQNHAAIVGLSEQINKINDLKK